MLFESLLQNWFHWMSAIAAILSVLLLGLAIDSLRQSENRLVGCAAQPHVNSIPISIIVPAYNEQSIICKTIQALLHIQYDTYELIVVNDGSTDQTLDVLRRTLQLREIPKNLSINLPCQPINHLFESGIDPRIRVVDKCNGGKFDALNAGISISQYPWFCCVDADTILMPDALWRMSEQVQRNPSIIAAAGQVRVGYSDSVGRVLVMAQVVEYIRSFVVERIGWSKLNGLVIVPGAFSLFNKQAVCEVGGYSSDMPSEDVELVLKLHQHSLFQKRAYKVLYVPDAIAWTETPANFSSLAKQRKRWYRGLWAAINRHRCMLFNPGYGFIGLFVLPYLLLFECLWPVFGVAVLALTLLTLDLNIQNSMALLLPLCLNFVGQCLISAAIILIDWSNFRRCYSSLSVLRHTLASILIERSIYACLLTMLKIQAFIVFVQPFTQGCGRWQTLTRRGFKSPVTGHSTSEERAATAT